MRARLREDRAQFFAKVKEYALEWAATAALAALLPSVLAIEERIVSWLSQFPPTWGVRAFLALIVLMWWRWIRWSIRQPHLEVHPESGTYIDRRNLHPGVHYCAKCRKEGPLRESKTGWRCFICDRFCPKLRGST